MREKDLVCGFIKVTDVLRFCLTRQLAASDGTHLKRPMLILNKLSHCP